MLEGLENLLDRVEGRFGLYGRYLVNAVLLVATVTFLLFCLDISGGIVIKWAQEPYRSGLVYLMVVYGFPFVMIAAMTTPFAIIFALRLWWRSWKDR